MNSAHCAGLLWALSMSLSAFAVDPVELRLWPGKASGSENWTVLESITNRGGGRIATHVSDPTLTVYLHDAARANGAAIVVARGAHYARLLDWIPLRKLVNP